MADRKRDKTLNTQLTVQLRKSSTKPEKNQTLVLFVDTEKKPWQADAAPKELQGFCRDLSKEQSKSSLKNGLLLRNCNLDGYANLLLFPTEKGGDKGDGKDHGKENVRRLAAKVYSSIKSNQLPRVDILVDSVSSKKLSTESATEALTEGLHLSAYEFNDLKSKDKKSEKNDDSIKSFNVGLIFKSKSPSKKLEEAHAHGEILAETQNFARWLGDNPGNYMTPDILAKETVAAAKGTKLKVTVWDKARIKKERMGGLYGVSLGSDAEPRFIIMEYNGAAKSKKPVVFVGKGLTFDTGGISIKPSSGMEEMKYDMCGGANVIGALLAIARLKLKVNVVGLVPASENMPGPLANKPGDILTARNGKSVEVFNTDAEGRLILMDALSYASEMKPAAIFDAATLTGAVIVALGNSYTAFFTKDKDVNKKILASGERSGEWLWPMPLCDHYTEDIKGTHADLCNISSFRGAGSSTAAAFLEQFVEKDIPWAHFDIAGTAWNVGSRVPYCPKKGASGVMVRTFVELSQEF